MKVLILLAVVAVAFGYQECGENAHFESCGTPCPLTCDNYDNPPKVCVLRCDIGCQCDAGYVKNSDGRCVRPEDCPRRSQPVCGKNQHYSECGSACPLTCDNYENPPKICPAICVPGCECDKGHVKAKEGRCVRPEECRSTETTCDELPEVGYCLGYFPKWYYDDETGKCHKFIYGGCGGNGNRYNSEEECLLSCRGHQQATSEACDLPAECGVCRGYFPRYFFDRTSGTCKRFVYGGCGGNENNFETIEACLSTCAAAASSPCEEEKVVGPCRAAFRRFFFNKETGKCELFIYGGCQGNSNNFLNKEDCQAVCPEVSAASSTCDQEKVVGPCRGFFPRFYFDKETGKCEKFVYGGCQGNSNNFETEEECQAVCSAV